MTSKSSSGKKVKETEKSSSIEKFSLPIVATINDIIRAIRILSDSGGQAKLTEIENSFGTKPSDKNLLGLALNAAVALGLVKPHRRRTPYVLSNDGKEFLSSKEAQRKAILLPKFLGFKGYRKILVAMKNSPNNALKKQIITDMWLQIRDKKKLRTRKYYSTTFASVGAWCGAITDTGQTCSLTPNGKTVLEKILKGEEPKLPTQQPSLPTTPKTPLTVPVTPTLPVTQCPYCSSADIQIENEELLETLQKNGTHILIIKTTYHCRGCTRASTKIGQRLVGTGD